MVVDHDYVQQIASRLQSRQTRTRTAGDGGTWLDCQCPLHEDRVRSASLHLQTGVFHCRVCSPGSSIPLDRVMAALAIPPPLERNGHGPSLRQPMVETVRYQYPYYWPNGELSHYHLRIEYANHPKSFRFQTPGGEPRRPETYWPIYGDLGLQRGDVVMVVEGEKAADAIACQGLAHVSAVTLGSTVETADLGAADILARRLLEVPPSLVALWPDNDTPGIRAMASLRKHLEERHVQTVTVDVAALNLPDKGDAADFLAGGGELAILITSLRPTRRVPQPKDVVTKLTILHSGAALWPGTEHPVKLDASTCSSFWQALTGEMPSDRNAKELLNLARQVLYTDPVMDYYRVWSDRSQFYWRPEPGADAFKCSSEGIDVLPDTPAGKLLAPGPGRRPSGVDPNGDEATWNRFCDLFGLSELERSLTLAWTICCLTGQETPIMLLRGYGNTGKSSLARALLAIVEPTCPEIDAGTRRELDERQLVRTLQRSPALLLDNVSSLPPAVEDILSRLVTEYVVSLRRLYSDDVELVAMRRALLITSTNWDVYKGDLGSRIIVCQPRLEGDDRLDADSLRDMIDVILPRLRGYVFKQACQYYAQSYRYVRTANPWRVASIGLVLNSLGLDARALYSQEKLQRASILNINDPWMSAMCDLWDEHGQSGEFAWGMSEIVTYLYNHGVPHDMLPSTSSPKFHKWVEEKQMLLRDHGFWMQRTKSKDFRGYWFRIA